MIAKVCRAVASAGARDFPLFAQQSSQCSSFTLNGSNLPITPLTSVSAFIYLRVDLHKLRA